MIEWVFLRDKKDLRALEKECCKGKGDFGKPARYPCFAFMHANFVEEQCAEFVTREELVEKIAHIDAHNGARQ